MLSWSSASNSSNRCFSDSVMTTSAPASVASWQVEQEEVKKREGGEREQTKVDVWRVKGGKTHREGYEKDGEGNYKER